MDTLERGGERHVVAGADQNGFRGLVSLTHRERQTVAHLAMGQSTKETAYTLGIAAATVRVLLARAAMKLGVRSRAGLLAHDEVRRLQPGARS